VSDEGATNVSPLHFDVKVPGLGLVEEAEALGMEISAISNEAEAISNLNPVRGYVQLMAVERKRVELSPKFAHKLGESIGTMRASVSGAPGVMAGHFQTLSLGQSIAATLILQTQWQRLVGTCDRKAAFLVAATSIYISVISLVLTIGFGVASFWPKTLSH
jgi:hypothetical protein